MTAAGSIAAALLVYKAETRKQINAAPGIAATRRRSWRGSAGPVVALLIAAIALYAGIVFLWEDFTYYDGFIFTRYTLRGHNFATPIFRDNGRFFPFGQQEFNVIRHFTTTSAGYHAWPMIQFLFLFCILLVLDEELTLAARGLLAVVAVITPGIAVSFSSLIFPERNVMLLFLLLVFAVKRFEQTKSYLWVSAAVVIAQLMVYYKEVASLLLLGFALSRLVLRCRDEQAHAWKPERLRDTESRLDWCLALVGVAFLFYYAAVMFPHPSIQYATDQRLPLSEVVTAYVKADPLSWLLVALLAGRLTKAYLQGTDLSPLWDGGAIGCLAYVAAYIYLRIYSSSYLSPVDVFATLYVGRFLILGWAKVPLPGKVALVSLSLGVLLQEACFTAYSVFEEKNIVHGKTEIAEAIKTRFQGMAGRGAPVRLDFPFTRASVVMQFAYYLNYHGIPIERLDGSSNGVILESRAVSAEGNCVSYESVWCRTLSRPASGDLIVVLPDDEASSADVSSYSKGSATVAAYAPEPAIPHWLRRFMTMLHVGPPHLVLGAVPDRWLEGAVFAVE